MGIDRGTGLAALRSPADQASTSERSLGEPPIGCARSAWHSAAALETTRRAAALPELEPLEADDGAVLEINQQFRRRLAGLRRLPRHQRADALRAARDWRRQALRALKERRAAERRARHLLRQLLKPAPR
jgi:hypothetical protein